MKAQKLICAILSLIFISLDAYRYRIVTFSNSNIYIKRRPIHAGFGRKNDNLNSKVSTNLLNIMKPHSESLCKCGSRLFYGECCEKYHNQTEIPQSLERLVRSRFCAYSIGNMSYIIETTHPSHKEYASTEQSSKRKVWEKSIASFIRDYEFKSIEFKNQSVVIDDFTAQISFSARVKRKSTVVDPVVYPEQVISELSTFKKAKTVEKWLYSGGTIDS